MWGFGVVQGVELLEVHGSLGLGDGWGLGFCGVWG